jgi:hypothetical protein
MASHRNAKKDRAMLRAMAGLEDMPVYCEENLRQKKLSRYKKELFRELNKIKLEELFKDAE